MSALIPNPRQAGVLDVVREHGVMSVEALAERFGVTLQTVRRDVKLLSDAVLLARFHGGVRVPGSTTENIAYRRRQQLNDEAKRCIARAVARDVPDGCSLILNIGTRVARAIVEHAREVWLAADHSKFNRPAMVELGRLENVDRLYTDQPPPEPFSALLAAAGVQCVVSAGQSGDGA